MTWKISTGTCFTKHGQETVEMTTSQPRPHYNKVFYIDNQSKK